MNRGLGMLVFIGVALSVLLGWHWLLWTRLVRDPGWPAPLQRGLTVLIVVLGLLIPASFAIWRLAPRGVALVLGTAGYVWMGLAFLMLVVVLGGDLLKLGLWLADKIRALASGGEVVTTLQDPGRRALLARAVAAVAAAGAGAATLGGIRNALGDVAVKQVVVKLARLPQALDGLSIVQISDLHLGLVLGRAFCQRVVQRVNALAPDAVVITGDLVDGPVDRLAPMVAPLAELRPRLGTYFATGNHEYYSGVHAWERYLPRLGVQVLDNQRVSLGDAGPEGASIDLAGIPDPTAAGEPGRAPDLAAALRGRDPGRAVILLAHQPRVVEEAARHGVDLVLSGHTHGGQIWPFSALVALTQPYLAGLHRHGPTQIYVSRGTGFWGPPLRLGAPAEITRIVLRCG